MHPRYICFLFIALFLPATSNAQINARMLRYPDVSETQIAFIYAGDIWLAPKTGGTAHRLSSPSGEESFPRFSPDGQHIAFTGNYDGNDSHPMWHNKILYFLSDRGPNMRANIWAAEALRQKNNISRA
jgi:Tol biopolymer transport system component